ncbi:hypothetical protein Q4489_07885 [Thalassotalea sp. 1_MG-2023]|uniref:hypothetical protein n=1 Tax=Thalassotalea sp. 1_MG-2023 TaxID=3062680 RepID=UPI0026E355C5|nr:hypothetical protein [Thalassotalea sp. 1_MG-2023]MDO6426925.1 hypothetical protein [Thalassotalea sp. 1_MG-2023]
MTTSWLSSHKQLLLQQIKKQTLPHALMVTGVAGSGKLELVNWLAQSLLCQVSSVVDEPNSVVPCQQCKGCHLAKQASHPDLFHVELTSNHVGVDQVRALGRFLEKTAQFGQHQVAIVHQADKLTEPAGNALLKTLEEPTKNSFIVLIANDEQRLLPTLISRCRVIAIRPPIGEDLLHELGSQSDDPFVNLSHLPEIADPQIMAQFHQIREKFQHFITTTQGRMALLELLKSNDNSARWLEKIMTDLLRGQSQWLHSVSTNVSFTNEPVESLSNDLAKHQFWQIYKTIKQFNQKSAKLSQFNREFGLEKLLVDIQMILQNKENEYGTALS